jgi:hypothetical protein
MYPLPLSFGCYPHPPAPQLRLLPTSPCPSATAAAHIPLWPRTPISAGPGLNLVEQFEKLCGVKLSTPLASVSTTHGGRLHARFECHARRGGRGRWRVLCYCTGKHAPLLCMQALLLSKGLMALLANGQMSTHQAKKQLSMLKCSVATTTREAILSEQVGSEGGAPGCWLLGGGVSSPRCTDLAGVRPGGRRHCQGARMCLGMCWRP